MVHFYSSGYFRSKILAKTICIYIWMKLNILLLRLKTRSLEQLPPERNLLWILNGKVFRLKLFPNVSVYTSRCDEHLNE